MQWLIDIVLENFKGMILMWSGAIVDIPAGWHLCDGTEGTPDLRNKFVPCAGDTYDPADTGGSDSQTHNFTTDGHWHTIGFGAGLQGGPDRTNNTDTKTDAGTTDAADNRPQFYSLAYIMKL